MKAASDDEERPISPWEEAWDYFGKWNVLLALMSLTIILVHIGLSPQKKRTGLDFWGVHFPDSFTELITSAIVVIQVERVVIMVYNYVRARYWQCKCFCCCFEFEYLFTWNSSSWNFMRSYVLCSSCIENASLDGTVLEFETAFCLASRVSLFSPLIAYEIAQSKFLLLSCD